MYVKIAGDDKFVAVVAASERKELNSSRNLEKGTRRVADGGGR